MTFECHDEFFVLSKHLKKLVLLKNRGDNFSLQAVAAFVYVLAILGEYFSRDHIFTNNWKHFNLVESISVNERVFKIAIYMPDAINVYKLQLQSLQLQQSSR